MSDDEKATVIIALEIIGKYGREAREYIVASLAKGALDRDLFEEAAAQIEDIA